MAFSANNHPSTSWFFALLIALLLADTLAHRSNASWRSSSSSEPDGGGSLQVPAHCRPEHAAALLQLKPSLTNNGCPSVPASNTTLSSWMQGTDCCRWEGVACDGVAGSVTGLNLSLQDINGSGLHPSLFKLTSLEHLILDFSDFCGSHLPASGFEQLTRLEDLSLIYCNISGPIPPSFAGLRSLKTISLASNDFSGATFPLWITHLKQLKVIHFDNMGLSGTIPSSIGNLSLLTELRLSQNNFSGGLPSSLSNLTYLSRLECSFSGLSGRVPSLQNLSRLEFLDLSMNNLEGNIPLSDGNVFHNLWSVKMRQNSFTGEIQASIFTQPALEFLDLSDNHLSGHIEEFQNPSATLKEIFLSNNKLTGAFPTSFFELRALTDLEVHTNNFSGNIHLSDGNMLRNLQCLVMNRNSFTGATWASIFTQPALESLDLSYNQLSGHIEEFQNPSATLKEIYLNNNKLTGAIPTSFSQLRALTDLVLEKNNFTGTLDLYPYLMLWNFSSLLASHNPLLSVFGYDRDASNYGSIIDTLELASCSLTRVPSAIRYLSELCNLDLSNNSIRGNIPGWIWRNMTSLSLQQNLFTKVEQLPAYISISFVNLSSNKLRGSVPFPFAAGTLDYSNNKFSSIPSVDFVRMYRTAGSIHLANNTLRGPIPYAECHHDDDARSLEILDLSGNNLSGPVPPYLLKQGNGCGGSIKFLNLRGNHLNGTWPDEMGESCSLELVDLHGNQMQGRLPRSLASCKSLRHLDVGGNKFVDVFPSWLGNLPNLWLLVLRSNQFYGPLTMPAGNNHSVENGYFSSLQFVDLAGNRFNGALPSEFFNVLKSMIRPQMNPDNIVTKTEDDSDCEDDYCHAVASDDYLPPAEVQVSMKQLYLSLTKIIYELVVIDLSHNMFSGCIPKTICNLTALHVLDLSHNSLSGNIPAEFGQLSKVESLDLSWNNLTGSIPQAMASLTNLEVLNLSYNDLSGSIPSGRQFSTFPSSSFQGGNRGLYGCPLPVQCNLTQPPSGRASAPAAPPTLGTATKQSLEAVILWLFVGSGYGVGIAVSIVLQMTCCAGRMMNKALEKIIAGCTA